MTVRARSTGNSHRTGAGSVGGLRAALSGLLIVFSVFGLASVARAQVAGSIDVESDYRLRGYSLSAGRPTATAQISYDHASGLYLDGSVIGVLGRDDPALLGFQGTIGYAKRLSPTISIDGGVSRSEYRASYSGGRRTHYTEAYVGVTIHQLTGRLFFSPDYFNDRASTLYGEVEDAIRLSPKWRLNLHAGALTYLSVPSYYVSKAAHYDWRVGASRQLGAFEIHAAVSGGGPGQEYYAGRLRDRTAVTAGASWSF